MSFSTLYRTKNEQNKKTRQQSQRVKTQTPLMLLNSISNYGKIHITDKDGICVFNKFIRLLCCEKEVQIYPQKQFDLI